MSRRVLYACVVCLASLLSASAKKAAMNPHQLALKEHYEHLAKVAEFECDLPQPRLLEVSELLSDAQMRGKAYFPEVTVLHRCDRHTGSCTDASYKCGPTHATTVKMPFKVTFLEATAARAKGQWGMEYHALENHTACGCLEYKAPPGKTAVHYHYIDPSLMPQGVLPLDPPLNPSTPNITSYDVPIYNATDFDEKIGEHSAAPGSASPGPSIHDMTKLAETVGAKPSDEAYPGYGGYPDASTSSTTPRDCDSCDGEATTISEDLVRFGSGHEDTPKTGALKSVNDENSPYDAYLKQAYSYI